MNTTRPTASSDTRIISRATSRLRTKPRVSGHSWAAFSDHITVCMAPLSDHRATTAPTAIMRSLLPVELQRYVLRSGAARGGVAAAAAAAAGGQRQQREERK